MNSKRLHDELTIVGMCLVVMFILYYLVSYTIRTTTLEERLLEAQKVAIILNTRLTETEYQLEQTAESIEQLQVDLDEYRTIEPILKDIATTWGRGKN